MTVVFWPFSSTIKHQILRAYQPGPCFGLAGGGGGGLQQPPDAPAMLSYDLRSLLIVPSAQYCRCKLH